MQSFKPGALWLDTEGKPIQAHGGSVIFIDGVYYWYGENKEKTDGKNGIWHWGVRCYSSRDLYNWEDKGLIIPPQENVESTLHPFSCMDRPHIIFNKMTGKYVCWLKIEMKDLTQGMTILTADNFLGPYKIVKENFKPFGMSCGDFDLVVDEKGKGYWYFEKVHSELICADLTDDFTDVTGYYTSHFHNGCPPYVREAPAHFERKSKHYLITSGTTGYYANPSEVACSDNYHGPFRVLGNPHVEDKSCKSFNSQISCVFKVRGKKDLYIACADRWINEDIPYDDVKKIFELIFYDKNKIKLREFLDSISWKYREATEENTSISRYVWLPIVFEGDMPRIYWFDEWKIEDFA